MKKGAVLHFLKSMKLLEWFDFEPKNSFSGPKFVARLEGKGQRLGVNGRRLLVNRQQFDGP